MKPEPPPATSALTTLVGEGALTTLGLVDEVQEEVMPGGSDALPDEATWRSYRSVSFGHCTSHPSRKGLEEVLVWKCVKTKTLEECDIRSYIRKHWKSCAAILDHFIKFYTMKPILPYHCTIDIH